MQKEILQNFDDKKRFLMTILATSLSLFLITLIVSNIVNIQNKIKEGRYIGQEIESKNTITVSGQGEIYAKPDLGIVSFSVTNEAKTVATAMEENTKRMNAVIEAVKKQGVEEKDLKTTQFTISPRYEWYQSGQRALVGYEVTQTIQVKIRDLAKVGEIIQSATNAGANQAGELAFTIDDEEGFKKQAREQAISQAKQKAKDIAKELDLTLVRVTNFVENTVSPYYPLYGLEKSDLGIGGGAPAPQIETGENKIEVTVSITYEID